jgi:DNA polymerase elongation subunit (family B)
MLNQKHHTKVLFIDIETTSKKASYSGLSPIEKRLFVQKYEELIDLEAKDNGIDFEKAYATIYDKKACLTPEFGKIVCISVGVIGEDFKFKSKSFTAADEKELLTNFIAGVKTLHDPKMDKADMFICGHNIKNFDIPFIAKRIVYNGLKLPEMLEFGQAKPWELTYIIDTKESLKFGEGYAPSLEELCVQFGIDVAMGYNSEKEIKELLQSDKREDIAKYCEHDLKCLAQVYLKLKNINDNLN